MSTKERQRIEQKFSKLFCGQLWVLEARSAYQFAVCSLSLFTKKSLNRPRTSSKNELNNFPNNFSVNPAGFDWNVCWGFHPTNEIWLGERRSISISDWIKPVHDILMMSFGLNSIMSERSKPPNPVEEREYKISPLRLQYVVSTWSIKCRFSFFTSHSISIPSSTSILMRRAHDTINMKPFKCKSLRGFIIFFKTRLTMTNSPMICLSHLHWHITGINLHDFYFPFTATVNLVQASHSFSLSLSSKNSFFHATCDDVVVERFMKKHVDDVEWKNEWMREFKYANE